MSLQGQGVVTGAARGLWRAIALKLTSDGADVSVWDLNSDGAEDTARIIRDLGRQSKPAAATLRKPRR